MKVSRGEIDILREMHTFMHYVHVRSIARNSCIIHSNNSSGAVLLYTLKCHDWEK